MLALLLAAGCSSDSTSTAPGTPTVREIDDLNYIHGQYYFLQLPSDGLHSPTLQASLAASSGTATVTW